MRVRGPSRRLVRGASGRRYSVCGIRTVRAVTTLAGGTARSSGIIAWFSGATLLLAASLSLYAIARPPAPAIDSAAPTSLPVGRYSVADFFNATR